MAADASIYGLLKPAAPVAGPLDQYAQMMSVKHLIDTSDLNALQRRKLTRDMEREEAFQALFEGAGPESISAPEFLRRAYAADPARAMALQKNLLETEAKRIEMDKNKASTAKTRQEAELQAADRLANIIGGVISVAPDQKAAAYEQARGQVLTLFGPDHRLVKTMPAQYPGDEWAKKQLDATLSYKDRITQTETARHNRATESTAAGTLAESKRYHNAMIGTPVDPSDPDYNQQIDYWATVVKNGGTLPPGLARGPGGGAFVREVTKRAAMGNVAPEDMMANQARFQGEKAGQRTLGTRTANIEMAATEAASLADLAKQASTKVDRTNYKTFNDVMQAAQRATSSPELRAFAAANTSLINAYARAINPQGIGTVADKEHAREMLSTAFSKGDYDAAVSQLMLEIDAAKKSPGTVQKEMRERFTGKASEGGGASNSGAPNALRKGSGGIKFLGWEG